MIKMASFSLQKYMKPLVFRHFLTTNLVDEVTQLLYRMLVFWLSIFTVVFTPLWVPVYFIFSSASRTIKAVSEVCRIASLLWNPKCSQPLTYGILKNNGKYLKSLSQNVYIHQLYDYSARRMLTLANLEKDTFLVEMECDSLEGLNYLKNKHQISQVYALQDSQEVSKRLSSEDSPITIKKTSYETNEFANNYDCIILLNHKAKLKLKGSGADLLQLLRYARYHISNQGFFAFGEYLEEGQAKTLQDIFSMYDLRVCAKENIQKNVEYSTKIITKQYHQNWETRMLNYIQSKAFYSGRQTVQQEFTLYILQKK